MKKAFIATLALLTLGCGNDNNVTIQTPIPSPSATATNPIGRVGSYLLAANSTGTNGVVVFRVNASGGLERVSAVTTTEPMISLEAHPTNNFIYGGGFTSDLQGFRLDSATGQLTQLAGFPVTSETETNVVLDQTGNFLYCLGDTAIDGFRVNQNDGTVTRLSGFPIRGLGELFNGEFDKSNSYLYVADRGLDIVLSYSLNPQTGMLSEVARIPAVDPTAVEVEPNNRFVYVSVADGNLNGYSRNTNGTLTQLSGLPVRYAPAGALTARFDFRDQTLFIGDRTSRTLNAFTVGNAGQLTGIAGFPQNGGGGDVVTYPLPGSFLYAADRPSSIINGFNISGASTLTPIPGTPFSAGGGTNELLPVVRFF